MKPFIASFVLASSLSAAAAIAWTLPTFPALAQTQTQTQTKTPLYYRYDDRQIPLILREDTIAVSFKETAGGTRSLPPYLMLQRALMQTGGTRGSENEIEVQPLGESYALVNLPADTGSSPTDLTQRIQQQAYVDATLPVMSLSEDHREAIVLPNEIVIAFETGLTSQQQEAILNHHDLELLRSIRFTRNRVVVRSRSASGLEILQVADGLNEVEGIRSATPNFIQSTTNTIRTLTKEVPHSNASQELELAGLPPENTPFATALLPLQWHLNSTAHREERPRTDIRALEAWQHSNGGEEVVVAVIDSLIQWDCPDLANRLYSVGDRPDLLPGEKYGWDFAQDDGDTRLSAEERTMLLPHFQNTFRLEDDRLLKFYKSQARDLWKVQPNLSREEVARRIRNALRNETAGEFHGTWVAGVIAAHPEDGEGVVGVAPNAKILPVRVFGVGGAVSSSSIIEAIGYAAARDADIINLSLGRLLPHQETADRIGEILAEKPNLVFVASAGNFEMNHALFPAIVPEVLAVGATNLEGHRARYSNYGEGLDVVAPGGDTSASPAGGILTTGGTIASFWDTLSPPDSAWGVALDPLGQYVRVQGTSFSAPAVSGVVALMKGVDPLLSRHRAMEILKGTARYDALVVLPEEETAYRLGQERGEIARSVPIQQYFFGKGLVDAEAAVRAVLTQTIKN